MSTTILDTTFDHASYDGTADVLYLHVGDPASAVDYDETPEGHALRFDARGQLVGLTIVDVRTLLESEDPLFITLSRPVSVDRGALARAVGGSA